MRNESVVSLRKDKNIEYIRAIACVGVVAIHVCKSAHDIYTEMSPWIMFLCMFFVNNLRWCVPVFLMITGALLLDPAKEIDLPKVGRYIWRIAVVLIVFGTCFSMMELIFEKRCFAVSMIPRAIINMLSGKAWDHLWYLYTLIMLYCFLPMMRAIVSAMKTTMLIFTCAMIVLFSSGLPTLQAVGGEVGWPKDVITIYMFYMLVGYILKNRLMEIKKGVLTAGILLSTAFLGGVAFFSEVRGQAIDTAVVSHASLAVIVQSICIFSLMIHVRELKNKRIERVVLSVASASFGIYVLHMVYINIFYKLFHLSPAKYTVAILLLVFALTFALTYGTVLLIKKVPIVKKFL